MTCSSHLEASWVTWAASARTCTQALGKGKWAEKGHAPSCSLRAGLEPVVYSSPLEASLVT